MLLAGAHAASGAPAAEPRPFLAYHASWYEVAATRAEDTTIARLPGYITVLALAFAKPDARYEGDLDLSGSGLQYPYSGQVLKRAVALLKRRNPQTKVILAVGGSGYPGWKQLDEGSIARLVQDLGLNGVDVDFEPLDPQCAAGQNGRIGCASDGDWVTYVDRLREALPRPLFLSVPGWSVGAYGEGEFAAALPRSPWAGVMLNLLRSPSAAKIDLVSIMAYEAGPSFRPGIAFRAYRTYWDGPLAIGMPVVSTNDNLPALTARILESVTMRPRAGAMLYALQLSPPGAIGPDNPDGRMLAQRICVALDGEGCSQPVP